MVVQSRWNRCCSYPVHDWLLLLMSLLSGLSRSTTSCGSTWRLCRWCSSTKSWWRWLEGRTKQWMSKSEAWKNTIMSFPRWQIQFCLVYFEFISRLSVWSWQYLATDFENKSKSEITWLVLIPQDRILRINICKKVRGHHNNPPTKSCKINP